MIFCTGPEREGVRTRTHTHTDALRSSLIIKRQKSIKSVYQRYNLQCSMYLHSSYINICIM